ncbi:MAG: DUF4124 domain-containing protein [Gammaproteobacteria bacterium]|nr:MAG: DUF4124 domain-containing protein [Gammaproteobacteria bacterium]
MVKHVLSNLMLSLALIITPATLMAAKNYKWVDAQGQVHYSNYPPPDSKSERIEPPPPPPTGAKPPVTITAAETTPPPAAKDAPDLAKQKAAEEKVIKQNCETAKKNLQVLKTYGRISVTNPDGSRTRIGDEERASRTKKAEEQVKEFCK